MCALEFSEITYTVTSLNGTKKNILHDINGYFPAGRLIAIMGPSGAGKSSLLNILTGFRTKNVTGKVRIDSVERNVKDFKKVSCYITQDDNLCDYLTVAENMMYAADFKLGPGDNYESKLCQVNEILISLGLYDQRDTMTGRLSGGEKKRLSVAQEMLSDPMFLFLDEPTTGLDSLSCYQCISELKNLTHQGKTVICTIHQPSDGIFKLFDQVYVLSQGYCTYQGDIKQMIKFFDKLDLPCSLFSNPADYIIEMSSGDYGQDKIERMIEAIDNGRNLLYTTGEEIKQKPPMNTKICLSHFYEFRTLLKWQWFKLHRNKNLVHLRIFGSISVCLLIGGLYFNAGNDASRMLHNYYMLLAFIIGNTQPALMLTILYFPREAPILKKELFNGYYRLKNYLIANTLTEYPLALFCTLLTSAITYLMTGQLLELRRFAMFSFGQLFVILTSQSVGLLIGSGMKLVNGIFVGSFILTPLMLLSGFGFMLKDLAMAVRYVSNFAYLKYCLSMLSVALFGMDRPKWTCPDNEYCLYMRGEHFIAEIGVDLQHYWHDVAVLCANYCLVKIATYFVMRQRMNK